jgi:hypothetical protein
MRLQNPSVKLIPEDGLKVPDDHKEWFETMVVLNAVVIV